MAKQDPSSTPWLVRVLGKWIWLLGLLPASLDYLGTYIPRHLLPEPVIQVIQAGATWQATLVLLTSGILASAFLVHREMQSDQDSLQRELEALTSARPQLRVAFLAPDGLQSETLSIALSPIPNPPDFDAQVSKERERLLARAHRDTSSNLPEAFRTLASVAMLAAFSNPNPDYQAEIEEYVPKYRKYLVEKYEARLARAFLVKPVIVNSGTTTASSVLLELEMPPAYSRPESHQTAVLDGIDEEYADIVARKPLEPEPYKRYLSDSIPFHSSLFSDRDSIPLPPDPNEPEVIHRDSQWYVTYHVDRLIPKRTHSDLNPFPIWAGALAPSARWPITARIFCAELPSPIEATLQIEFRLAPEMSPPQGLAAA